MYKGFLKGDGKRSAQAFKGNPDALVKWDTARRYESCVGVLDDDYVMVDIDTIEESELLLDIIEDNNINCSALQTTKGIHLYFRGHNLTSNRIEWFSPLGVQVTLKLGSRNTVDPLKIDGEWRKWIFESDDHDPLPAWLYPIDKHKNPINDIAVGNRNQELFNYILKLQRAELNKQQIRQTINLVNQYVLDQPLSQREINTILRDEAFVKQSFFKDKSFLHDKFARFLIQEHHIVRITDVLHIYDDGVYSDNEDDIERAMISHLPGMTRTQRQEVMAYLQLESREVQLSPVQYIVVNNGIYNLSTDELEPFTPTVIVKNKIPVNYIPNSYCEPVDRVLNNIAVQDQDLRQLLEEIFGYVLLRRNEMRKSFILTGHGQNGKSTFLHMLRQYVGAENTSSLDIKELDQRFKTAELFGKLVNIGDDIAREFIKNSAIFKKLVTGDAVNVERKGKDPFDFQNYSKLIFSANDPPRINDTSDGLISRLLLVPFNARFTPEDDDYDPFIHDKVTTPQAMEYLLNLGIEALQRLLRTKQFTIPDAVVEETKKYEEQNNPVLSFIKEVDEIEGEATADVYAQYRVWVTENGNRPVSRIHFSREICKQLDLETVQQRKGNKRQSVFVKVGS